MQLFQGLGGEMRNRGVVNQEEQSGRRGEEEARAAAQNWKSIVNEATTEESKLYFEQSH